MNTSAGGWIIAAAAAAAAVFVLDALLPLGYSVPMLYVLPILLTGLLPGWHHTIVAGGSALLLTWVGAALSPGEFTLETLINRAMASALLLAIGWLLLIHKESPRKIAAAQQARDASEERLRLAQAAANIGTFDWDIPAQTVVWSAETERIWGVPLGSFGGTYEDWRRQVHPDDVAEAERLAQLSLTHPDIPYVFEHRLIRPDGTVRWIHAKAKTLRDVVGRPIRMIGVNLDITERKRAEEALRESEERLRLALEGGNLGSWDVDVRTGFARWNRRHALMQGYEPVDGPVTMDLWRERVHPDDLERVMGAIERAKREHGLFAEEHRLSQPDNGDVRWLSLYGRFFYDDAGEPIRFSGVSLDITDRKQAEAKFRESEQRFRAIYDQTYEFIGLLYPDGRLIDANQTALAFRGLRLSDVVEKPFWETPWWDVSFELQEKIKAGIGKAATGEFVRLRAQHRAQDGAIEEIDFSLTPIVDQTGTVTQIITEGRRITALVKIQDRLRQAHAELERRVQERTSELEKVNAVLLQQQEELRRQQQRLQDLTGKLLVAQESERQRIAQELHDDITQRLAALTIDLRHLRLQGSPVIELDQLHDRAKQLTTDVQRLSHQLHPSALDHLGLEEAVHDHVEEFAVRTGLATQVVVRGLPSMIPLTQATCLYRVLQESLQNIQKHANATSVLIRLLTTTRGVGLCVHDDGRGFEDTPETARRNGLGLTSMAERVGVLQGTFRVKTKPGDGTEVHAWVPLELGDAGGEQQ